MKYTALIVVASCLSIQGCNVKASPEQQIIFADKAYIEDSGLVYIAGTLTGEGVSYPNNSTAITCFKDRRECLVYSIEQIGQNQISRLDIPQIYELSKWSEEEVVMTQSALNNCRKETVTIVRKSQTVVWVQEATNQSQASCVNSDTRLYKWSIDRPAAWKAMFPNSK